MSSVSDKIRMHIGEGELEDAIDSLVGFSKNIGGDLYNQSIHLKGEYSSYKKELLMGTGGDPKKKAQISMAVLELAEYIDKRDLEKPPSVNDFEQMRPNPQYVQQQQQNIPTPQQPVQQPSYYAQCIFNGDMMQYFVTHQNQIIAINPMTNQSVMVGMKMPSQDMRYAWTYYFTSTGMYYLIDHAGIIWGQSFGMPAQMGYVKYF